jgi:hypothetical protein
MMKIGRASQVVVVQMPLVDLGCLCLLPDFRQLMARFPQHIKVNLFFPPYRLALNRQVVPFVLAARKGAPILEKLRRSLQASLRLQALKPVK